MKQLSIIFIILMLLSAAIGSLSYWQSEVTFDNEHSEITQVNLERVNSDSNWQETLKSVSAYYRPPKGKTPEELEAQRLENERLAQAKKVKLEDGVIVGVVVGENAKTFILLPGGSEPEEYKIGEGWLEPFVLVSVNSDSVTWKNTENNNTVTQLVFG